MYLLTSQGIHDNRGRGKLLEIDPFNSKRLGPTCYYFGLGSDYQRYNTTTKQWQIGLLNKESPAIAIQPNEYLLIESLERFRTSDQCLGVIGSATILVRRGLSLRHSPFIDPNFPAPHETGFLELGMKNETNQPVEMRLGERIGKVMFYNIADTYPIHSISGTPAAPDFARRASASGRPIPAYDDHPVPVDDDKSWRP